MNLTFLNRCSACFLSPTLASLGRPFASRQRIHQVAEPRLFWKSEGVLFRIISSLVNFYPRRKSRWTRSFASFNFVICSFVQTLTPPTTRGASTFFAEIHACNVCREIPAFFAACPVV